jgi:anti-sigma regulatory factor (Ser/Thr protein kinase)
VRPVTTIANFDATLRQRFRSGASTVRAIGEVQFGPTPAEWRTWTAYEGMVNRALAEHPAWIVCPYDARVLPDAVLDAAWDAHPHVITDDRRASSRYHEPEELVASLTPAAVALPQLRDLAPPADPAALREQLAAALAMAHVPDSGAMNMLVAANEIALNAWRHAGGATAMRAGLVDGRFVVEITDRGSGLDDPLAGYVPPRQDREDGTGLWIARQLVSRMELLSSPRGLSVRLWL